MFLLFYFFAFLCVRNVVLKEKFWVENFILFKLCYFYVIIYPVAFFYLSIFRRKPRPIRENYQYLLTKNKLWHLIIIRCHSLLSQKLDSIKPLSHPHCVLISGSNDKEFLCACNDAGDYNDFILLSLTCFSSLFSVCFAALYSAAELIFTHTATAILSYFLLFLITLQSFHSSIRSAVQFAAWIRLSNIR